MRKIAAIMIATSFALAGCGTTGDVTNESATGNNRPDESSATESAATESSAAPSNPTFGQAYEYEDGLVVTVSAPQPYTPSDSAFIGEPAPPAFIVFDVTIVNGSQANYDPSMFTASLQSANVEQEQVYDSANGLGGSPTTAILPGRESVFKIAFGATDPADLVMQLSPSFEHDSVIYTS